MSSVWILTATPIGQTVRYRLSPYGDRHLNAAIHTIATTRRRCHRASRAYLAKRTAEGKTSKEITRCLKRAIAREMFAHLNTYANPVNTT